ncbi:MAG: cysteine desulfurase [Proteobacteria bacterium]|nr:cysteine desulfurase [Pseudomonadota bacterium]
MNVAHPVPGAYDVAALRRDFPILERKVHGCPLVYLDNAASAQKPNAVLDAMNALMTREYANVHRGVHFLSAAATDAYERARVGVQRFLNAAHEDEIVFTRGGTEAINLVAESFVGASIRPGDEIVLSVMEHHSNIVPWHFLRERAGAVLKWVDVSDAGELDPADVARAIGPKTKLVAITHMSNVLGTRTALKEIVRIAHEKGVRVLADGCQSAVHGIIDVQDLDVDFYAVTGHKLYGPTGIGVLYGKRECLKKMRPYQGGGEMIHEVTKDKVTYADPPMRFEAGTPPIVEAVGLAAAVDYLQGVGREAIALHEEGLARRASAKLKQMNGVRLIGEAKEKGPIVSFEVIGIHAHDLATILDREGVAVRAGHHCAQVLMDRFGVVATARASFGLYNTEKEVDALIDAVKSARKVFG